MATILIMDGHVLNRQFLMVLLGYSGHRLIEAVNGTEGLGLSREKHPDLIIADMLMPDMDGHEFVTRLRAIPDMTCTPVIFYTAAHHGHEASRMAAACGVRWILPKPSDPELILKTVHEALGLPLRQEAQKKYEASESVATLQLAGPRFAGIDNQFDCYLEDLETSSHLMAELVRKGNADASDLKDMQHVVQRLSKALSSLQAVSLRLTALIDLGIELACERDPVQLLEISCRAVQDICLAKYTVIGVLDENGKQLRYFVTHGIDKATLANMERPAPYDGLLGDLLGKGSAQRLHGLPGDPRRIGLPAAHPPIHSILAAPVASQERTYGWLYLADKLGASEFSEIDERAAVTVCAQLAVIYENLVLYSEIQHQHIQLRAEIEDRKRAQETLHRTLRARIVMAECNHVMVHATDEASLLKDMCQTIVETGKYRMAWIGYANPEDGTVMPVAHAGSHPAFAPASEAVVPIVRMHSDARSLAGHGGPSWGAIGIPAEATAIRVSEHELAVSLPLKDRGRVFGVLTIYEAERNSFDAQQVTLLEQLANDISYGVVALRTRVAREAAEHALSVTEEKLSSILDSIDNVVWSMNETGFVYLNPVVEKIYGRPVDEFFSRKDLWFGVIHEEDRLRVRRAHQLLRRQNSLTQEYRIVRPDGQVRWIEERARAIRSNDGRLLRFDGIAIDISERKGYEARIEYLADHDALTDLANRNLLGDRITQAMAHARRNGGMLALLFLDLDRFKGVNDSFGHELGDALLLEVSGRLKQVVREGDTVARQGGDEFILLLTDIQRPQDVTAVAQKIFEVFLEPFHIEKHELFITTSIGATLYPGDADDMQTLLRNADTAMYRAKEERGNAFQFYSREMSIRALERAELENSLRRALDRKEFELFYQPKVEASSGRIIGAEALIRWNHPEKGMVSPTRFIPMAEEIGLIVPIGDWVLQTACAQNKAWQDAGLPPISVSVNLSARQLRHEGLVESVAHTLKCMDLDAKHLELELTESIVMSSAELFVQKLRELEDLGVQLSIDDFGTGYSSLSYLKRFPLHHLKIDQSFVRDIATDMDDAAITSTVISLGHSLNLKVIAEGVETEEQVAFLREHHCDEMQGYYFSKPLPADQFADLLQQA